MKNFFSQRILLFEQIFKSYLSCDEEKKIKNKLNSTIHFSVDSFLFSKGFIEDCTCFEYLKYPPLNYEGVENNKQILEQILQDFNSTKNEIKKLEKTQFKNEEISDEIFLFISDLKYHNLQNEFWKHKTVYEFSEKLRDFLKPKILKFIKNTNLFLRYKLNLPILNSTNFSDIESYLNIVSEEIKKNTSEMVLF